MKLISTRNAGQPVSFYKAITDCIPPDGGLYVPREQIDLSPWILHLNEKSSFASIACSLTSAFLKEEISPVLSESIAAKAYSGYSPRLRQLDDKLFLLELFHGHSGCHRDFGFLWLASVLEHILTINDGNAVIIAMGTKRNGSSLASAFGNKKRLKTILLHPKGFAKGIKEEYLVQNGGSIYSVECGYSITETENLIRAIYQDRKLVEKYKLTLVNTVNIGRLIPQIFFYMFVFSRLKRLTAGEIYYALHSGNYGNLAAGLYAWKNSLFVHGFITDATPELGLDEDNLCFCKTSNTPLNKRDSADPATPSNIERLEQIFEIGPSIMRTLIFPKKTDKRKYSELIKKAYLQYGIMLDTSTAAAYSAALDSNVLENKGNETLVLISKDHPAFEADIIEQACNDKPFIPEYIKALEEPVKQTIKINGSKTEIEDILKNMVI